MLAFHHNKMPETIAYKEKGFIMAPRPWLEESTVSKPLLWPHGEAETKTGRGSG